MDAFVGFMLGIIIASLVAFEESDSANRFEFKYGEFVCSKNSGFQYFEKSEFKKYEYHCQDGAVFTATDTNIKFVTKGWFDYDKGEDK